MEKQFKTLRTLHLAVSVGALLAFLNTGGFQILQKYQDFTNPYVYIYPLLVIALSQIAYQIGMRKAADIPNDKRAAHLQNISLIRWIILDIGFFIAIFTPLEYHFSAALLFVYLIAIMPKQAAFEDYMGKN